MVPKHIPADNYATGLGTLAFGSLELFSANNADKTKNETMPQNKVFNMATQTEVGYSAGVIV